MRRPIFRMGGGLGKGPRIAPGAGAPAGPTLRGHNLTLSQSGSVVAPFVTGAAAGDTAFLFCSDAWAATAPAGWSTLANDTGAFINGAIFTKVLSAGDISAGNVTVSFAGGYGEAVAQACFIGAVTVRDSNSQRSTGALAPSWAATDATPQIGDVALWCMGIRDGGATRAVDRGTVIETNSIGAGKVGAALLAVETLIVAGVQNVVFTEAGAAHYLASVVVH
jgi:hypothetical protein